ncbi:MAG: hypothetical protein KDA28_15735, partial [Phycisphaerales bacterium]|nr:hypothetical protein [Phycisphaerales bacterium]
MTTWLYRLGLSRRPGARMNTNALGLAISLGVHALLALVVFALTLTVVTPTRFTRLQHERITLVDPPSATDLADGSTPGLPGAPTPLESGREPDPVASIGQALESPVAMPSMALDARTLDAVPRVRTSGASFAGLRARKAASVVYVVDASGPMASSLSFVFDELRRSVARLGPSQTFQAIIFRDTGEGPTTIAFPAKPAPANELNTRGL